MTPFVSALLAVGWLALISACFWWYGIVASRARERGLVDELLRRFRRRRVRAPRAV